MWVLLTLFIAILEEEENVEAQLAAYNRIHDRRIKRIALQDPQLSPIKVLLSSTNDQSLITFTGFDFKSFNYILRKYEIMYNRYSPYTSDGIFHRVTTNVGRSRSLDAKTSLTLTLAWTRTRGSMFSLCVMFGITSSVCAIFLRFGRAILLKVLSDDKLSVVRLPTTIEVRKYQQAIKFRHHLLTDVFAVADGLKLRIQQPMDHIKQNRMYNEWTHGHYVSSVFVFAPDGVIIACSINAPGSMHDSQIAELGGVYSKLEYIYARDGCRCVVDSAFSRTNYPFLIKSSQDAIPTVNDPVGILLAQQATSLRQASEWGMRGLQGSFPHLKDTILFEERGERKCNLLMFVLLFNLRSRLVGINHILTTYFPILSTDLTELIDNSL